MGGWQGGGSCSRPCLHQGIPEGDGHGVESPGPGDTVVQGDLEEIPVVTDLGWDTQGLEDQSPQQSLPSHPKAGELSLSPFGVILLEGWWEWH